MIMLELDRMLGSYNVRHSLSVHPSKRECMYSTKTCILISNLDDSHDQKVLQSPKSIVSCLSLSSSGRYLASGQEEPHPEVLLWDYDQYCILFCFSEHESGVVALAFSGNERVLCSIDRAKRLILWDLQSGNICATLNLARDVRSVAFSDAYSFSIAGDRALSLCTLIPRSGELIHTSVDQTLVRNYCCLAFSFDRQHLLAGSSSGDVAIVLVRAHRVMTTLSVCSCGVSCIVFTDSKVFIAGGDGTVTQFSMDYVSQARVQLDGAIHSLSVSFQHEMIVAGTAHGTIYQLGIRHDLQQRSIQVMFENPLDVIIAIAFACSNSDRFATITLDRCIRLWNACDYSVICRCRISDAGMPLCLQMSSEEIYSGWEDGRIRCHSARDGSHRFTIDDAHRSKVSVLLLGSHLLFSGGCDGEIRGWDMQRHKMVASAREHGNAITGLVMHGAYLVTSSRDGIIICWEGMNCKRLITFERSVYGVTALASDGRVIVSAGMDEKVLYWDLKNRCVVDCIEMAHAGKIECLTMAHGKGVLATAGSDHLIKLWDLSTKKLLRSVDGHYGRVLCMSFSPDDRQLITGSEDGCVMIWNLYIAG